jgi:hypothetical protein
MHPPPPPLHTHALAAACEAATPSRQPALRALEELIGVSGRTATASARRELFEGDMGSTGFVMVPADGQPGAAQVQVLAYVLSAEALAAVTQVCPRS